MQWDMLVEYWWKGGGLNTSHTHTHTDVWQMDNRQKLEAGVNSQEPECEIGFDSEQIQDNKTLFSVISTTISAFMRLTPYTCKMPCLPLCFVTLARWPRISGRWLTVDLRCSSKVCIALRMAPWLNCLRQSDGTARKVGRVGRMDPTSC